jgi:hypothetical protein
MWRLYKKIKFENFVLLSGVIEGAVYISTYFIDVDYVFQIIEFLETIIVLFITRRFLKIYFFLNKKNRETKIYNYFFFILALLNTVFMVGLIVMIAIELATESHEFADKNGNSYIQLAHNIFSFFTSLVCFIWGVQIKKMIRISLSDTEENLNFNAYIEENSMQTIENDTTKLESLDPIKDEHKSPQIKSRLTLSHEIPNKDSSEHEIYFHKRMRQINIVTTSFLICDVVELIYVIVKLTALNTEFEQHNPFSTHPVTNLALFFEFFNDLALIVPIFTNFLAFYFLIRNQYIPIRRRISQRSYFEADTFVSRDLSMTKNKDIEEFLM